MKVKVVSAGKRAGRSTRAAQTRREALSVTRERADARRAGVYRTDVDFAPEEVRENVGSAGGPSTRWVEPIKELYGRGMSQLDVAVELGISAGYVSQLVLQHGIVKGRRRP